MGAFKSAILTKKGQELLTKTLLGKNKLEFTQIKTSEGVLSGDLASRTDIGTVKQAEKVASIVKQDAYTVKVSTSFSNEKLTAGYYIRNIGLYAMDPTEGEILYSISVADESTATADWMPPFNGAGISSLMIDLITSVSNASTVKIEVDPTASATVAQIIEVNEHLTALDNTIKTTTEKLLSGSVAGGVKINKVCGKNEQVTTTGKNLLVYPYPETTTVKSGVTFTDNGDGTISVNGTATAEVYFTLYDGETVEGAYYLSGVPNGGKCRMYALGDGGQNIDNGSGAEIADGYRYITLYIPQNVTVNNEVIKPMLNEGTTAIPYEPYTGSIPAPNPDYPQEIRSVVVSEIFAHGKNLLIGAKLADVTTNYGSIIEQARFRVTKGKTYTISADISANAETSAYWNGLNGAFNNETIKVMSGIFRYSKTFVALKDIDNTLGAKNLILMSKSATSDEVAISASNVQIEENSVATEFEPYIENSITLSQPVTLNSIGEVTDELTSEGVVKRVAVETVSLALIETLDTTKLLSGTMPKKMLGGATEGFCSICHKYAYSTTDTIHFYIAKDSDMVCLYMDKSATDPTEATFGGILAEEYVEPLPVADQLALRSLVGYDGVTHLATNSEVDPDIEVEYGTNKVGAHTLTGLLTAQRNEIKLAELTSTV